MFTAVFWNIQDKGPRTGIVRLISGLQREHDADVIVLAECSDGALGSLLRALNSSGALTRFSVAATTSRVRVLVRNTISRADEVDRHEYYSILKLARGAHPELLLAAAPIVSRLEKETAHIDRELERFATDIRGAERTAGHDRSIVIGDLNAHPFSDGVVSAVGLHGVTSRPIAGRGARRASHRSYPFFFNPMWRFLGDASTAPAGTYYREAGGDHTAYYWHLYDQVLIRPSLLPFYGANSVCIVTDIAGTGLAGAEFVPDRSVGSDHYPVRIRLSC